MEPVSPNSDELLIEYYNNGKDLRKEIYGSLTLSCPGYTAIHANYKNMLYLFLQLIKSQLLEKISVLQNMNLKKTT